MARKRKFSFPKRKRAVGFEILEGHGPVTAIAHMGPRLGQTTFPVVEGMLAYATFRSHKKRGELEEKLEQTSADIKAAHDELKRVQLERARSEIMLAVREAQEEEAAYVLKSVLMAKRDFSRARARRWIRDHGLFLTEPEDTLHYWRFRQIAPELCDEDAQVINEAPLGPSIQLVRCRLKG